MKDLGEKGNPLESPGRNMVGDRMVTTRRALLGSLALALFGPRLGGRIQQRLHPITRVAHLWYRKTGLDAWKKQFVFSSVLKPTFPPKTGKMIQWYRYQVPLDPDSIVHVDSRNLV